MPGAGMKHIDADHAQAGLTADHAGAIACAQFDFQTTANNLRMIQCEP
jgi:hypothetical protein